MCISAFGTPAKNKQNSVSFNSKSFGFKFLLFIIGVFPLNLEQRLKPVHYSGERVAGRLHRCGLFHVYTGNFK